MRTLWPSSRTSEQTLLCDYLQTAHYSRDLTPSPLAFTVLLSIRRHRQLRVLAGRVFSLHCLPIILSLLRPQSIEKPSKAIINYSWINNTQLGRAKGDRVLIELSIRHLLLSPAPFCPAARPSGLLPSSAGGLRCSSYLKFTIKSDWLPRKMCALRLCQADIYCVKCSSELSDHL